MSTQSNQKMKRNGSPSTSRHGPMRATKQFGLGMVNASSSGSKKQSSRRTPTSPTPSKTKGRSLSETGFVTDSRSPTSPSFKVEKPKALHAGHSGSLESISYYLSGQWPKDVGMHQSKSRNLEIVSSKPPVSLNQNLHSASLFKKDQQTQTPEEWEDHDKNKHLLQAKLSYKRTKSVGSSSDQWSLKSKEIKQKLRGTPTISRYSPVQILLGSSQPIRIPTPTNPMSFQLRGTPGKQRASAEGHNPEIEKLIIAATSKYADEETNSQLFLSEDGYPDGRRAPVLDLLRTCSVDTQTPSQFLHPITPIGTVSSSEINTQLDEVDLQSNTRSDSRASTDTDQENSRPQSTSPIYIIPGSSDFDDLIGGLRIESPVQQTVNNSAIPKPKNEFVRSPPDGAERVKLDELATAPRLKHFLTPIVNSAGFQPSERSAFQSLHAQTGTTASN